MTEARKKSYKSGRVRKTYRRRRPSRKNVCSHCHRIIRGLPYQCHRCDRTFCSTHRLPEAHKCAGLRVRREPVKPLREPLILVPPPPTIPEKPELPREPSIQEAPPTPIAVTRPMRKTHSAKKRGVMLVTTVLIVGVIIASFFIYYKGLKKSSISMFLSNTSVTFGENVTSSVQIPSSDSSSPMPTGWVLFQVSPDNVTWENYDRVTLSNGCCTSKLYSPPGPGNYWFRTVYSGDANYKGSTSQAEALIVNKDRPAADFHWENTMAYYNTLFFDGSIDRYGNIVSWSWDFGDNSTSNSKNPFYTYTESGNYEVRLTVTNNVGESDTCTKTIYIQPWKGEDNEWLDEVVQHSTQNENGVWVISGITDTAGNSMILHNNPYAKDPTWDELMSFLRQDTTEQIPYVDNSFVCADFAENLHNNAEKAGIRAAYVVVNFTSGVGHGCDAFRTTDRGLVFIDDTGEYYGPGYDKQVNIVVGQEYVPTALFSSVVFSSMGTVHDYWIQW